MSFFRSFSRALRNDSRQPSAKPAKGQPGKPGQSASESQTPLPLKPHGKRVRRPERRSGYLNRPKNSAKVQRQQEERTRQQAEAAAKVQLTQSEIEKAKKQAEQNAKEIVEQAQAKAREAVLEAKSEALKIREQAEREAREIQEKLRQQQANLDKQIGSINDRLQQVDKREDQLDQKLEALEKRKEQLEAQREELVTELENVSGLTREQAKAEILERLERRVDKQAAQYIQQKTEEAKAEADNKAKEILVDAMKHGSTDYVAEYTISVVKLPDAEMKGRIIGKDGRNIRSFERATGVDVELDETPEEVRLSCFDPVRREIARISLERLLKDGRIQPTRIEEVVKKVERELDKIMFEEGKRLCHAVGIYNLPNEIMQKLGRFKYRFSYGQNLIQHTLEETQIGIKIAQELGLNVRTVTMGCLLHDIGKVIEGEGNHVELGVNYLKRMNMPQEVIDCVAQHHEDEPFTSLESVVVYISDAISGARPGARSENHEEYVQRLGKLEEIAEGYDSVRKAFAIQAGREVRVILEPDRSSDRDVNVIATSIAERYENEMTYPGTVTVNVIREIRGSATAK